ncbi:MAG TPA: L,D-transpeptidase [Xanthobacteraceae bacterium]|nr:L,D-transpeptidase [Xanthobacteraceae bacterium]
MLQRLIIAAVFLLAALAGPGTAFAGVVAEIEISMQRMTVTVDGFVRHVWPVSTARAGYATPTGSFTPIRLERVWYSRVYDNAPMPYAIFFHYGFAIHGTNQTAALGRPASHGCVRLHTENARELFELIRAHGLGNSHILITG